MAGGVEHKDQDINKALQVLGLTDSKRSWLGSPAPSKWKSGGMIPTPAAARDTIMDFRGLVGGSALASFRHAKMHAR